MGVIEGGKVIEGARQNVLADVIGASALGVAAVMAAVTDTGVQQIITTGLTLDRPRRITATVAASTAAHVKAISVIVAGLDPIGLALTETLPAFTDNTPGTVTGTKVFAKVTSVTIPAHDGATALTSLGATGVPAVASATGIHAAVADTGAPQTVTTAINQPDVPRNITATVAASTANDVKAISVVITGTNCEDTVITETLPAFTDNTPGAVAGLKAFKTVTSILIPAHDGATALTSIGFGDVIGIGHRLAGNTVQAAYLNRVLEATAPTVVTSATDICLNTADLNSNLASVPVILALVQTQ